MARECRSILHRAARLTSVVLAFLSLSATAGSALASSSVDFGDTSHKGRKTLGPASTGLKLSLELGMIANQQGIANAVKAASDPSSSTYGKYLSLSALQSKYGASSSRRNAVVGAFKPYGVTATVDVTHLRVGATISINSAQKLFGTKWDLYATGQPNQAVALPVNTPKLGSGLNGNVDTVSGLGLYVRQLVGVQRAGFRGGWDTGAHRNDRPRLCLDHISRGRALERRPVSQPDSQRLRDRPAAGQRPAGPGLALGHPRRSADAGWRRQRIPQLFWLSRDCSSDPRSLQNRTDPRELA